MYFDQCCQRFAECSPLNIVGYKYYHSQLSSLPVLRGKIAPLKNHRGGRAIIYTDGDCETFAPWQFIHDRRL